MFTEIDTKDMRATVKHIKEGIRIVVVDVSDSSCFIQSAARSPPGRVRYKRGLQTHRFICLLICGVACRITFGLNVRSTFQHISSTFEVVFNISGLLSEVLLPPRDTFGVLWWYSWCRKIDWGAKGATRGAKVESPKIKSLIWTLVGSPFLKITCIIHEINMFFIVISRLCFCLCFCVCF